MGYSTGFSCGECWMADQKRIAVFAEDRGHEEFLRAVIERIALEMSLEVDVHE